MPSITSKDLHGIWALERFEITNPEGATSPWGAQVTGQLIYHPSGHMSVAINKAVEPDPSQSEIENKFDSVLSYSGTYQMEDELIRHQVTNASNPDRVGKEMVRFPSLTDQLLHLKTPQESFGSAVLVWRKVA